jgi:hypothetical protein
LAFVPPENGESIQILRYEHGQKYEPHWDYFQDKVNQARGGHRYATVLMYLSTVEKGGETVFPNAEVCTQQVFLGACALLIGCSSSNWCRDGSLSPRTTLSLSARKKDWQVQY